MALYLIGDIQGCHTAFTRLLHHLDFSPSRDTLFVLGDLVNRGPDNVGVLRRLRDLGSSARCLLGNHDLHLISLASGLARHRDDDTLRAILKAPDRDELIAWLRTRPMMHVENRWVMVHAGLLPQWDADQAEALVGDDLSDTTRATLARATVKPQAIALALGSPEFQRR